MHKRVSMREALSDDNLLGKCLPGPSWLPWRILLIAAMGEALDDSERIVFKELTGRDREPGVRCEELVGIIGRRGGKSRALAVLAVYCSGLCEYPSLVSGEKGCVVLLASDMEQAAISLGYIEAAFRTSPVLRQLIAGTPTVKVIKLTNGIEIRIRAGDYRKVRGVSIVCCICDESCFWISPEGGSNPDVEVIKAIRPALATTGGMLCLISSPHAKTGEVWNIFKRDYGPAGDPAILVAKAPSRKMNSTLPQYVVDRAYEKDYAAASAEYGAEFRNDVCAFIDVDIVKNNIMPGVKEIPPAIGTTYSAFCDPSGGSSDSFTLAIGYADGEIIKVCAIREVPAPFSPEVATAELSVLLKSYRVSKVVGDKYAGMWPSEAFNRHGIAYESGPLPKSGLYLATLPLLNSGRLEMPDNPRLINQLAALERRVTRSGRDTVDHPQGAHDDVANAVAGLCTICSVTVGCTLQTLIAAFGDGITSKDDPLAAARANAKRIHGIEFYQLGAPLIPTAEQMRQAWADVDKLPKEGSKQPGALSMGDGAYRAPSPSESIAAVARLVHERAQQLAAEALKTGGSP